MAQSVKTFGDLWPKLGDFLLRPHLVTLLRMDGERDKMFVCAHTYLKEEGDDISYSMNGPTMGQSNCKSCEEGGGAML